MRHTYLLLALVVLLFSPKASAQIFIGGVEETVPTRPVYTYINPLDFMFERNPITGTLRLPESRFGSETMYGLTFRDTLFYNPNFLPVIFSGRILPRNLSLFPIEDKSNRGVLIPQNRTFAPLLTQIDFAQDVRRRFYVENMQRIRHSVYDFPNLAPIDDSEQVRTFNPFRNLARIESALEITAPDVTGATIQRRYWQRSGEHSLQFSQHYFSENWHRRGNNHLLINSNQQLRANYRKDRVRFDNTLEWRLSFQSTPDDTLRNYTIGNDLIRYLGRFSYDAVAGRGWAYSTTLEVRTQTFNHFPSNSPEIRSAFLSPLTVNPTIGMTYRLRRNSERVRMPPRTYRFSMDLDLNPFSASFTYVHHPDVDVRRHGIEEGRRYNLNLGSSVRFEKTYYITRFISWFSRFHYQTNYSRVEIELDNRLTMRLTNAFTTRIYLHLRYDDGVFGSDNRRLRDERFGFLQVNQMLSFGLNYRW